MGKRFPASLDQPAGRIGADGQESFTAGEVATLLDLGGLHYSTLAALGKLARASHGEEVTTVTKDGGPRRVWARYSLTEILEITELVRLGGGRGRLAAGRRLNLRQVGPVCDVLRRNGYPYPLVQVSLQRAGRRILAEVNGYLFDPLTDQGAFARFGGEPAQTAPFGVSDPTLAAKLLARRDELTRAASAATRQRSPFGCHAARLAS